MGLNLHKIVRRTINAVNADQSVELYRMTGRQQRDAEGDTTPIFTGPFEAKAQIQSPGADDIQLIERLELQTTVRRFYLYASGDPAERPWAQWRPLGRSGDLIKDKNGYWWLINSVVEDFSESGWVCVLATMQTTPIDMIIEDPDANP
nr:MAG TPA: head closure knob [Caudoviricetes sp.]